MRILLDTSYLYDLMDRPGTFSEAQRSLLAGAEAKFFVSAASIWEMHLKFEARHASGERKSRLHPRDVVGALEELDVNFVPVTVSHAAARLNEPLAHKDPFDQMLLVQAQEEGLRLLTIDRRLADHPLALAP